jgi:hypothetical protein
VGWSFQTTSSVMALAVPSRRVPPQPSTDGLEAGKSTCASPSATPSLDPWSPAATVTTTPSAAASSSTLSSAVTPAGDQLDSGPPQLIETATGSAAAAWMASPTASAKPWSVFGAKYTT